MLWESCEAHPTRRARAPPPPPPAEGSVPGHSARPARLPTGPAPGAPGPGKAPLCNSARPAAPAAAPPNRSRPLPHAPLFLGGRGQRAPPGWAGAEDPMAPTHPLLRTGARSTAGAPWWLPCRGRRLQMLFPLPGILDLLKRVSPSHPYYFRTSILS
nr:basic proline-rich protein-like [Pan paniscus]